ncbi:MAG: hypothetical protein PHF97_01115 [Bacteroidales bacterium]|nr:hypothetical protein [Bacteroidales bacterium]MDD4602390.1 hypothetical protein [Bacteroidales bacterium]
MKMIYCTCNVSVVEQLTELLEKNKIRDYQILDQVIAKNKKGQSRFNTPIWPGFNSSVLMQVNEEEKVVQLLQTIKEYNKQVINDDELITVCTWKLEDYFYD